jgi:hypothetical protein
VFGVRCSPNVAHLFFRMLDGRCQLPTTTGIQPVECQKAVWPVNCSDGLGQVCGMMIVRVPAPALSHLHPALRLAGPTRPFIDGRASGDASCHCHLVVTGCRVFPRCSCRGQRSRTGARFRLFAASSLAAWLGHFTGASSSHRLLRPIHGRLILRSERRSKFQDLLPISDSELAGDHRRVRRKCITLHIPVGV